MFVGKWREVYRCNNCGQASESRHEISPCVNCGESDFDCHVARHIMYSPLDWFRSWLKQQPLPSDHLEYKKPPRPLRNP